MSLYPTLEDMKVDQMVQAENRYQQAAIQQQAAGYPNPAAAGQSYPVDAPVGNLALYPSLADYMGLQITQTEEAAWGVPARENSSGQTQIAPVTGNSVGLRRAEIKQGVREIQLCKDGSGKMGLRVRSVNNGIFVAFVHTNSPAAMVGLRFGDQILQVNGQDTAGWDTDKAMKILTKLDGGCIKMAIRDRPFERTITMNKDSQGYIGFVYDGGRIKSLVKDSSAARNGLLTDHQMVEVNGQNVVGLKDTEIKRILDASGRTITVTVMPCFVYNHIIKNMGSSLMKKFMDHSIPDA